MANVKGAAPLDQEVAKLIKVIDAVTMEASGRLRTSAPGEKIDSVLTSERRVSARRLRTLLRSRLFSRGSDWC